MKLEHSGGQIVITYVRNHSNPVRDIEKAITYASDVIKRGYELKSAVEYDDGKRFVWTFGI